MRISTLKHLIVLPLASLLFAPLLAPGEACAQNIVVLVNDEPITSFDVAQRQRWLARTSNYGDRMKALLTGDGINQRFRQLMMAAHPTSQVEAQKAAERIKKELVEDAKRRVLSEGGASSRKAVIEALIDDRLKLQAAKKLQVKISDKEVEESLSARAQAGPAGTKPDMNAFYAQFEADGINRKTIKEIVRAQLAWRDVIRKNYGPRIASMMAAIPDNTPKVDEKDIQFDVRVLRLAVRNADDQKAVGERMLEAENLKEKFRSCADLPKEAGLVADATVKKIDKAKLASFPKDVQPLIEKVAEGQMTPPVLVGNAVESYAVCRKSAPVKPAAHVEQKPDPRQAEYERFSRSYLQELRQKAAIDYRGS
ncbi:MAG: SurA N-terminal domain-containing protein [Rhodomicrobium sp.]